MKPNKHKPRRCIYFLFSAAVLLGSPLARGNNYPDIVNISKPSDNYRSGFHAFAPPVSSFTLNEGVPEISEWTRQNQPGDTMVLTGENFDADGLYFLFYGTNGTHVGNIQSVDGRQCAVTLPANLPPDDVYLMWPHNISGYGEPVAINAAEAWWIGAEEVAHGGLVRVYGRNLKLGDGVCYLYIQELDRWLESSSANPYMAEFTVPGDIPVGSYTLYVHNGHGREYGWSDPLNVVIKSAYNWAGNTYDFEADFGADGSDENSDQAAFDAMWAAVGANPGSTVNFPSGTYYVSEKFIVKGNTRYIGQGMSNTVIKVHSSFANNQPMLASMSPNFELKEMTFVVSSYLNDPNGRAFEFNHSNSRDGLIENVEFRDFVNPEEANHGFMALDHSRRMTFRGCKFIMGQGIYLGPCSQLLFDECDIEGLYDSNQLITLGGFGGKSDRTAFTGCTVKNFDMSDDSEGFGWCKGRVVVITGSVDGFYMGSVGLDRLQPRDPSPFWTDGVITSWSSLGAETNVANLGIVKPITFRFSDIPDQFHGRGNNSFNWKGTEFYIPVDSAVQNVRGWVKELDALNDEVTIWIKQKRWPEYDNLTPNVSTSGIFLDIVDNNAGEQILVEGPGPIQAGNVLSATPTSIFILSSEASSQGMNKSTDLFITGGRGMGQARAVELISEGSGEIVISEPWRVVPDETSTYSIGSGVRKMALYDNVFSGRESGIGNSHVATTSLQINNSHDVVFASNTLINVRHSLRLYSYQSEATSLSGKSAPGPNFFMECIDNDISGAAWGFYTTVGMAGSHPLVPGDSWTLGHVFRKNRVSGITKSSAFEFRDSYPTENVIGLSVLDGNEVSDLRNISEGGKVVASGQVLLLDENATAPVLVGNQFEGNTNIVGVEAANIVLRENNWSGFSQSYGEQAPGGILTLPQRYNPLTSFKTNGNVMVWNSGTSSLQWNAQTDAEWLSLGSAGGTVLHEHDVGTLSFGLASIPAEGAIATVRLSSGSQEETILIEYLGGDIEVPDPKSWDLKPWLGQSLQAELKNMTLDIVVRRWTASSLLNEEYLDVDSDDLIVGHQYRMFIERKGIGTNWLPVVKGSWRQH